MAAAYTEKSNVVLTGREPFTLDVTGATKFNTAIGVASGGTGATSLTGYVKGDGTSTLTSSSTIPGSDVSGNITGNAVNVTGTVAVANGGTGLTTATGYIKGSGSSFVASATIPGTDVSGNITGNAANVTGTVAVANGGTGTTTGSITGTGALAFTAGGTNTNVTLAPNGTGTVSVSSKRITSLATPTQDTDAATKGYVDAVKQGLDVKESVRVATTANITLSGTQTIDEVSVVAGNRVLVKNQSTASQNGIYVVAAGAWTRAADADSDADVTAGMFTFVAEGTANADSGWILTTNDAITLGTTALAFTQFSGAGQVEAGDGLAKTGNTLNVNVDSRASGTKSTAIVSDEVRIDASWAGQTSITTLGTVATGTWNASTIAVNKGGTGATSLTGYVKGNGTSAMTASSTIPGADVSGNITGNAVNVTGTVAVANGGTGATNAPAALTSLGAAAASHTHGNITNAGAIGSTANLPLITTTSGVVTTGSFGTAANTFCQGNDSRLSDARTPTSHVHGNITNAGAIGSTANVPIITGTGGVLQAGSFGTAANTFCQGNDSRLSDARTPTSHVLATASGLGGEHTVSGLTSGQVLKAKSATTAQFEAVAFSEVSGTAAVSQGGTGASTTSGARTNLQLPYTFGTGGTSIVAWQSGDNVASGDWSVVNGGKNNTASNLYSTVGGGAYNTASASYSTVAGGQFGSAIGAGSAVGGGSGNAASASYSTVGGGYQNAASDLTSAVCGGGQNTASGQASAVGGGQLNTASGSRSIVGGGYYNTASSFYSVVGGGRQNTASGSYSTVGGGGGFSDGNRATSEFSTVSGGYSCRASASYSTVGGGSYNTASGFYSTVGGGRQNTVGGFYATIPGGNNNTATHNNVFLLGSSLVSDANDTTYVENLRLKGGFNTGVTLGTNAFPTGKVSIRSAIVNLKAVANTTIFTVPTGYMFLIDTMEVVTTAVTTPGTAPTVQFGNTSDSDAYYGPTLITSNAVGARHIVENPQDGVAAGTAVTFGVTVASTASAHSGVGIVTGYLLKTS